MNTNTSQPERNYSFPPLVSMEEIENRLKMIFPEEFPDRGILVGKMAVRVIFVFLYGGFIEGQGRFLRPSFVYFFTEEQSRKTTDDERSQWLQDAPKSGFRPPGERWYADTSREPIRDDLMRNQLLRLGIMQKLPGYATTASTPINYLSIDFAALFHPELSGPELSEAINLWRQHHLDQATLQRMALRAQGIQAKNDELLIEMPDKTRIRISSGPSAIIIKGLIEDFAIRHLDNPAVLWLSASDKKSYPQFVALSESVGLKFDLNAELPDLILADLGDNVNFLFCEAVATDGAVTNDRKDSILRLIKSSDIPESAVHFMSAFEDRSSSAFRKNFSKLALDTLVWFRTEPDLLVILSTANLEELDPNLSQYKH